ncbi:uncharacterized protein LOC117199116 isoform X2 [Orcinus orca]|uniref:uncharacterized protein LOC117199116 isoform X2 n=1 Tax=Orcinus orca TaxID=9733 RepID=UPI0021114FC3|nr:uncharacterized protein LOC117199116 isoform X2 [Orcinus orca]
MVGRTLQMASSFMVAGGAGTQAADRFRKCPPLPRLHPLREPARQALQPAGHEVTRPSILRAAHAKPLLIRSRSGLFSSRDWSTLRRRGAQGRSFLSPTWPSQALPATRASLSELLPPQTSHATSAADAEAGMRATGPRSSQQGSGLGLGPEISALWRPDDVCHTGGARAGAWEWGSEPGALNLSSLPPTHKVGKVFLWGNFLSAASHPVSGPSHPGGISPGPIGASSGSRQNTRQRQRLKSNLERVPPLIPAVPPVSRPTPGHYHVLYRGCGETQLGWHGETYCLVGGYRLYGDVPLATPAKVEAEKPVPRRAPKRKHSLEWSDEDLGCPRPKIRRLELSSSTGIQDAPLATPAKVEAEKPVPRRAPKRKHSPEMPDEDLGCSRPKIRQL